MDPLHRILVVEDLHALVAKVVMGLLVLAVCASVVAAFLLAIWNPALFVRIVLVPSVVGILMALALFFLFIKPWLEREISRVFEDD